MCHRVDSLERPGEPGRVGDVRLDQFIAVAESPMAGTQVVVDDSFVAR